MVNSARKTYLLGRPSKCLVHPTSPSIFQLSLERQALSHCTTGLLKNGWPHLQCFESMTIQIALSSCNEQLQVAVSGSYFFVLRWFQNASDCMSREAGGFVLPPVSVESIWERQTMSPCDTGGPTCLTCRTRGEKIRGSRAVGNTCGTIDQTTVQKWNGGDLYGLMIMKLYP